MSSLFPVKHLCDVLDINRSGFYKWKKRLEKPSDKLKTVNIYRDIQSKNKKSLSYFTFVF